MQSECVLGRHITRPDFHFRKMVVEPAEGNELMEKGERGEQSGGCCTNPGERREGLDQDREVGWPEEEMTSQIFRREIKQDWCLLHGRHKGKGGLEDDLGVKLR